MSKNVTKPVLLSLLILGLFHLPVLAAKNSDDTFKAPEVVVVAGGVFITGSSQAERELGYQLDERAYGHSITRKNRWYDYEGKRQEDKLPAYSITKNLITNGFYARFVAETGYRAPDVDQKTWTSYRLIHPYERTRRFAFTDSKPPQGRAQHPVVLVSHKDAEAFAQWLSKKTGKKWQLPTEKQWEKAARGKNGLIFPWGDTFDKTKLNSNDTGAFDTVPVGSFPTGASPYGMLDGAGQVFEWTATATVPKQRYRVKGGSWDDKGCGVCRSAARHARPVDLKHILIGFRLVFIPSP